MLNHLVKHSVLRPNNGAQQCSDNGVQTLASTIYFLYMSRVITPFTLTCGLQLTPCSLTVMDATPTALFDSYEQDFKHIIRSISDKLEGNGKNQLGGM